MAEPGARNKNMSKNTISKPVAEYIENLSDECRMLVVLKSRLYGGSWEPMVDDLQNRLAGKPYIFKVANRIEEDIERIGKMREFEAEHNVDLADYVELN